MVDLFASLLLIEPRGLKIGAMLEKGETAKAAAEGQKLMNIVKFDYTVMLIIIADMVLKPGWGDLAMLGGFGLIVAAGAVLFLVPALKATPAAA